MCLDFKTWLLFLPNELFIGWILGTQFHFHQCGTKGNGGYLEVLKKRIRETWLFVLYCTQFEIQIFERNNGFAELLWLYDSLPLESRINFGLMGSLMLNRWMGWVLSILGRSYSYCSCCYHQLLDVVESLYATLDAFIMRLSIILSYFLELKK